MSQVIYSGDLAALCNTTTRRANATGVNSFDPAFWTRQGRNGTFPLNAAHNLSDASWLLTVDKLPDSYASTFWFGTGGEEYRNDEESYFDACAFIIGPRIPLNTLRLSQDDPGDCSVMLTARCREALTTQAAALAKGFISSATAPPNTNLSAGVMPYLCQQIADRLAWKSSDDDDAFPFPKECSQDFGHGTPDSGNAFFNTIQLTGNNKSQDTLGYDSVNLGYTCPTYGPDGTKYHSTWGFGGFNDYDVQIQAATPILSVYFAVANALVLPRPDINQFSSSQLRCVRPTNVSADSVTPAPLPAGTPYPSSDISTADLAGIVVGSVIFVILCALLVGMWWWRRRVRRKNAAAKEGQLDKDVDQPTGAHELERGDKYELSPVDRKPEIDGAHIRELGVTQPSELESPRAEISRGAVEMDATRRWSFNSSRASISSYNTAGT